MEDERERASECVWVRIHKAHDTNPLALIRKSIKNGFAYTLERNTAADSEP